MDAKQIPYDLKHLAFGFIRIYLNQQHYPIPLIYIIISHLLSKSQEIKINDIHFPTDNTSRFGKYFTSFLTAIKIHIPFISIKVSIASFKIEICSLSNCYIFNGQKVPIKCINGNLFKFNKNDIVSMYLALTRKTNCQCIDTEGKLSLWLVPNRDQNEKECYHTQICNLSKDNGIIRIRIDDYINWQETQKINIISYNKIQFIINNADALFMIENKSQRTICCETALTQFQ